jgi:fibronectin-binding autotransporter adhesin
MKPRNNSALSLSARPSKWLGLCTLSLSLLTAGSALAQTSTWDGGGGDSNWNTGDNWSSNTVPTGGVLNFFGTTQPTSVNNLTAGTAFTGITLTNNGTTGQSAGFSLSGNAITLGGNITTTTPLTGATAPENGVAMSATINLDLNLSSNSIFTAARNGTTLTGHNLTVSGLISETVGPFSLTKAGNANLALGNTANSFSGTFSITGNNDVTVGSIQPAGTNSSIGKGSVINMSSGNLIVNGNAATAGDINRTINLTNTGGATYRFQNDNTTAANSLAFVSAITNSSTNGTTTFTLAGSNTGANEFRTAIVTGSGTNTTVLSKINGGRWILSGNNTYKGATSITAGVLNIRHANALGAISGASSVANLGQLQLEGGISYAAEPLSIASGAGGAAQLLNVSGDNMWNGAISTTGTGATVRVQSDSGLLTLAGAVTVLDVATQFVLQGNGNITLGGAISGPGRVSSSTTGTGVRTLAVANSYTGVTNVTGGVLRLNDVNSIPGGIGVTGGVANLNMTGGILGLGNGNLTRSPGTGVDQIQLTLSGTGFAAYGADRSVNLGGASASLTFGDTGFFFGVTGNPTLVLSAPSATHTLDFQNPVVLTGIKFFRVDNGSADVDARLSGAITGSTSFSKAGAGTLELTNTGNAWTSTTFIDSGTLRLGADNVIPGGTLTVKRGNGSSANGVFDLAGFSDTIGGLNLGEADPDAGNVGQTPLVTNSVGTTATLTLGGTVTYLAGPGTGVSTNGQATILANLVLIGADNFDRSFQVANGPVDVDLQVSGNMTSTGISRGLIKNGTGTMMISGTNNYTGQTKIVEGTLRLGSDSALPSVGRSVAFQGGSAAANTTGPVLDINGRNASIFALFLNTATPAVAGISSSVVDSATGGLLTLGSGLQYQAGGAQQNGPSTVSAALSLGAASRTFTVNDSTLTSTEVTLSGGLSGAAGSGLTKDGAGVLALSGAITYSGNTTVGAGTLSLGAANPSNDASTVTVDAGAVLNLAYSGTDTVTSLVIGGVAQSAGVYGATEFPGTLTGSGTITVTAVADPYLGWAGIGVPFDGDANNDGVQNGLAWLLGASGPNVSALDKLPLVAVLPGGGLQLTFNMLPSSARGGASLALQHSSDLGISDPWASVLVPDATGGTAPVTFVVSGTDPLNVVGTVASSEAAGGKLFGRLRANR